MSSSSEQSENPGRFDDRPIVRRAGIADVAAVIDLAKSIPTLARWSRADYEMFCEAERQVKTQAKAMFVVGVQAQPDQGSEMLIGFAAFSAIPDAGGGECELGNMAVAGSWRRRGIALRLLAVGLLWCRAWCPAERHRSSGASRGPGLWLEVRAANRSAIAFYERAGFQSNGRRTAYYTQPDDDAILMWKPLTAPLETC